MILAARKKDVLVAATLVAGTLACSWGVAFAAGTTSIPRSVDWGFARVAFDLHRTGHLHLINWGPMTIIAHLLWAQPFLWLFGDHRWVLSLSTSVLAAAGLLAAYSLSRLRLGVAGASATVVVLLAFPGVVRDAATYMSDPPALALQLITLALAGRALRAGGRRRHAYFAAALASGFWAFGIRELTVAAPLAALATGFLTARSAKGRLWVVAAGAGFGAACLAVWLWHHNQAGVEHYGSSLATTPTPVLVVSGTLTLAVAVAPAVALSLPRWWHARHVPARVVGALLGAGAVAARPLLAQHLHAHNWWLVGDYLQADGINGGKMLLGYRPIVLDDTQWHAIIGIAAVSTVVCGALVAEWAFGWLSPHARAQRGPIDPVARLAGWHLGLSALSLMLAAAWNGVLFDRYMWPMIFSGAFLLLGRTPAPTALPRRMTSVSQIIGACTLVVAFGATTLLTLNSAAFDAARWNAATAAVHDGAAAHEVDGGVEWDGAHSTVPNGGIVPAIRDPLIAWWTTLTRMERVCVVVTASPLDSALGREIRTVRWRPFLFAGNATLHVYELSAPACL